MKNIQLSQQQLAVMLAMTALILWVASLLLVGFYSSSGMIGSAPRGLEILFYGVLFGWLSPIYWTVYSNLFFIYAVFKLLLESKPKKSAILMAILGSLLLLGIFGEMEMLINEGGSTTDIISWGWGAIILLFVQSLVVIATLLVHKKIPVKSAYIVIGLLISSLIGVGVYGAWQRVYANDWEYKRYFLSAEIAFTKRPISGLPYQPLTEKLSDNTTMEVVFIGDISSNIKKNEDAYPRAFWQDGKFWRKNEDYRSYRNNEMFFEDTTETRQASYRLEISQPKNNHYLYTLYDLNDKHTLYQHKFIPREIRYFGEAAEKN